MKNNKNNKTGRDLEKLIGFKLHNKTLIALCQELFLRGTRVISEPRRPQIYIGVKSYAAPQLVAFFFSFPAWNGAVV